MKSDRLELYRLAKKVRGLHPIEKQTLLAITDAASMHDAECRKSKTTIYQERGLSPRSFFNGLHGRKRPNGVEYFPGLLNRGLVSIKSGGFLHAGAPTIYIPNGDALRRFADEPESSAQSSAQGTTELGTNSEKLGTSADQLGTGAQQLGTGADKVPGGAPSGAPTIGTNNKKQNNVVGLSPSGSPSAASGSGEGNPNPKTVSAGASTADIKPGGQRKVSDDVLENYIVRVKVIATSGCPIFSEKSREKLRELIPVIESGGFAPEDFEAAVNAVAASCEDNEKGYAFFGTTFVNNLLSDMRSNKLLREKQAALAALAKQITARRAKQTHGDGIPAPSDSKNESNQTSAGAQQ